MVREVREPAGVHPAKAPRVLLVEESARPDPVALALLSLYARRRIALDFASHIELAVAELARDQHDVVVIDPALPSLQGAHPVARLRSAACRVAVIASVSPERENEGVAAVLDGANAYLLAGVDGPDRVMGAILLSVAQQRVAPALRHLIRTAPESLAGYEHRRGPRSDGPPGRVPTPGRRSI